MAPNNNLKSVDTMLKELDTIFKSHYLGYKKHQEPYTEIMNQLKTYKNAHEKENLLIAIQNKFDSKETFLNLESNIWGILFVIIGLFVTMISDLILSNYDKLDYFNIFPPHFYVAFVILIASVLFLLYCLSTHSIRKKSKAKCYYKFVYDFLKKSI